MNARGERGKANVREIKGEMKRKGVMVMQREKEKPRKRGRVNWEGENGKGERERQRVNVEVVKAVARGGRKRETQGVPH